MNTDKCMPTRLYANKDRHFSINIQCTAIRLALSSNSLLHEQTRYQDRLWQPSYYSVKLPNCESSFNRLRVALLSTLCTLANWRYSDSNTINPSSHDSNAADKICTHSHGRQRRCGMVATGRIHLTETSQFQAFNIYLASVLPHSLVRHIQQHDSDLLPIPPAPLEFAELPLFHTILTLSRVANVAQKFQFTNSHWAFQRGCQAAAASPGACAWLWNPKQLWFVWL